MINGVYCHETGCPVEKQERREAVLDIFADEEFDNEEDTE